MEIFTNNLFEWFIVIGLLALAVYTMKIISEEKTTFKDDSYTVEFFNLSMMIPNWWTIVAQDSRRIRFKRTDTRYDWYAVFEYFPSSEGKNLPDLLEEKLNLEKIEFDLDVVFETDSRVLFRDSKIQEYFQEIIRVEGKASENVINRIYYDIYLMRSQGDQGYFIFESKSSVLNGLVEGPYFEESLAELSFIRES